MLRRAILLRQRPLDLFIVAFFVINLFFITYIVDIEQIIIADPYHFTYPLWPPAPGLVEDDDLDRQPRLRAVLRRRHLRLGMAGCASLQIFVHQGRANAI